MSVIIEVGANLGQDTEKFLEQGKKVYCFEPIPDHAKILWDRFGQNPNFHLMTVAIDSENGYKKFNIWRAYDWGCSSLHDVAKDNPNNIEFDYYISNVMCMRLDTFMDLYGITEVDYLHVDTQGNDFRVLQSLGNKIDCIKEGVVEVAQNKQYYDVEDNWVDVVKPWLEEKGFSVRAEDDGVGKAGVIPNGNEANLFFKRT